MKNQKVWDDLNSLQKKSFKIFNELYFNQWKALPENILEKMKIFAEVAEVGAPVMELGGMADQIVTD